MQIDWFTLIAQIVNFLILVWLLKHFLYDRIVKAMDKRREKIAAKINEADDTKSEAEKLRSEYQDKLSDLEDKQDEIISGAREKAEEKRKEMTRQAREEIEKMRLSWKEALENEKQSVVEELRRNAARQVFGISRKVLNELADVEIEEKIVQRFLDRFSELSQKDMDKLKATAKSKDSDVRIDSAFEISGKNREKLTKGLKQVLDGIKDIDYQTDSDLVGGVVLEAGGQRVEWNIADYLENLENDFKNRLSNLKSETAEAENQTDSERKSESEEK